MIWRPSHDNNILLSTNCCDGIVMIEMFDRDASGIGKVSSGSVALLSANDLLVNIYYTFDIIFPIQDQHNSRILKNDRDACSH